VLQILVFEASPLQLDLKALPPRARQAFLYLQAQLAHAQAAVRTKEVEVSHVTDLAAAQEAQVAQLAKFAAAQEVVIAELKHLTDRQEHLIAELRHARFGKKSEKLCEDERQLAFEDLEVAVAETQEAIDQQPTPEGKPRRKAARRNRGNLPTSLPRIEQVIEPENKVCICGCTTLVAIGEDRSERLDVIPAQFRVLVTVRPRYACTRCDAGILQAPAPPHLIEGGLPTEALMAHVAVAKYADHLPLYRQSQIYARAGIDLDRSTLASWCGVTAFNIKPVVDHMLVHIKTARHLFMDETRAPVLDPGAGKTKTGYLWALARDGRGWGETGPLVVFTYGDSRAGAHAMAILHGFDGILQVDGYTGYDALTRQGRTGGKPVQLAYCWAHARRKLHEVYQRDASPIAAEGIRRIAQLYKIEADIRGKAPDERLAVRQTQTAPLVAEFRQWLTQHRERVSPKSRLGEKLGYIHRHWDGLVLFLTDGRIEMDTNPVENRIRPLVLTRKNALFAGHDEGGRTWARIASVIETCKLNSVDPYAYLRDTLTAIANGHPMSRIDELMPWAYPKKSS
jgi:transposase